MGDLRREMAPYSGDMEPPPERGSGLHPVDLHLHIDIRAK